MAFTTTTPPLIGATATPHVVGYMINMILYGMLVLQTYLYYIAFPSDKWGIKALVYSVFLGETLQTVMMLHDAVEVFGLGYGDVTQLLHVHLLWFSIPILSCIISSLVQSFFAWRIHVLGQSIVLPLIIMVIVLLQLGSGIAQGVFSLIINDFSKLPKITAGLWLVSAAVCDVLIAICMTYILSKKQSAFKDTNALLTRVVRMTIETGALTAVMAVITAVLDLRMPMNDYFVPPSFILGKLYSNNLLVIFNSRVQIAGGRNGKHRHVPSVSYGSQSYLSPSLKGGFNDAIRVTVQTYEERDDVSPQALVSPVELNTLKPARVASHYHQGPPDSVDSHATSVRSVGMAV